MEEVSKVSVKLTVLYFSEILQFYICDVLMQAHMY